MAQELKAFEVGLGRYCKDGSPCVVAFATGRTPRVLNKKIYLKSEVDTVLAEKDAEIEWLNNALDKERSETIKYMDELCNAKNEIERLTIDRRNDELRADVADATVEKLKAEIAERKEKYNELAKLHDKAIQACCDADKVITELEMNLSEIQSQKMQLEDDVALLHHNNAELKKQVHDYAQGLYVIQARGEKESRHHKYKRCLDKAEYCKVCSTYYFNVSEIEKDEDKVAEYRNISDWYDNWEERWLELAEKFKEAK